MKTRPILFNADMVRALLDGSKTQTRRPMKNQPTTTTPDILCSCSCTKTDAALSATWIDMNSDNDMFVSPHGKPGDLLYVRETFKCNGWATDLATIFYKASENKSYTEMCEQFPIVGKNPLAVSNKWTPSIHMPRWASRLTLEITDVRVERVQDISEEDAKAEGIEIVGGFASLNPYRNYLIGKPGQMQQHCSYAPRSFQTLWDSIYSNWNDNPWVWCAEFRVIHANVDEVLKDKAPNLE